MLVNSPIERASAGWQGDAAAGRYVGPRFRTARAAGRDGKLVLHLLRRLRAGAGSSILDLPCGTGRLAGALLPVASFYVGADVSGAMLGEARNAHDAPLAQASAAALPFADNSFDVIVCCRLLHHLRGGAELATVLRELVRVSRRLVIASFFDGASWGAWRRRIGVRREGRSRRAISRQAMEAAVAQAGAQILGYAHSLRFVSQQVFFAAEKGHAESHAAHAR